MQAPVGGLAAGPCGRRRHVPAAPQHRPGPIRGAVMPGSFDQQASCVPVAGLGHRALRPATAGGIFRGHQAQVGADGAAGQAVPVPDLGGQPERGQRGDPTDAAQPLHDRG